MAGTPSPPLRRLAVRIRIPVAEVPAVRVRSPLNPTAPGASDDAGSDEGSNDKNKNGEKNGKNKKSADKSDSDESTQAVAAPAGDDGSGPGLALVVGLLLAVPLIAGGGYYLFRRYRQGGSDDETSARLQDAVSGANSRSAS